MDEAMIEHGIQGTIKASFLCWWPLTIREVPSSLGWIRIGVILRLLSLWMPIRMQTGWKLPRKRTLLGARPFLNLDCLFWFLTESLENKTNQTALLDNKSLIFGKIGTFHRFLVCLFTKTRMINSKISAYAQFLQKLNKHLKFIEIVGLKIHYSFEDCQ